MSSLDGVFSPAPICTSGADMGRVSTFLASPQASPHMPASTSPETTGSGYSDAEWNRLVKKLDAASLRGGSPPDAAASWSTSPSRKGAQPLPSSPPAVRALPLRGHPGTILFAASGAGSGGKSARVPHSALSPSAAADGRRAGAAQSVVDSARAAEARAPTGVRISSYSPNMPSRNTRIPHSALSPSATGAAAAASGNGALFPKASPQPKTSPAEGLSVFCLAPYSAPPHVARHGATTSELYQRHLSAQQQEAAAYLFKSELDIKDSAIAAALASHRGQPNRSDGR